MMMMVMVIADIVVVVLVELSFSYAAKWRAMVVLLGNFPFCRVPSLSCRGGSGCHGVLLARTERGGGDVSTVGMCWSVRMTWLLCFT
jgi:hypothetical protein